MQFVSLKACCDINTTLVHQVDTSNVKKEQEPQQQEKEKQNSNKGK